MYGFGVILEQAKEEMQRFVPQLVPKLFRYRFDPDPRVQQSMRHLWQTLLAGRKNVVSGFRTSLSIMRECRYSSSPRRFSRRSCRIS